LAWNRRFFADNLKHFSEAKPIVPLHQVLQSTVDPAFDFTENTLQRLKNSTQTDKFVEGVQVLYNQNGGARMGYTVFGTDGVAPTLTSASSRHYERYKVGDRYRRLTNVEYARLQGFPDQHCSAVSIYNQYPLYGNAIPPIFVSWLIHKILQNCVTALKAPKQQPKENEWARLLASPLRKFQYQR
jgi:DNA (cytosine-5)-methyltransferase 1